MVLLQNSVFIPTVTLPRTSVEIWFKSYCRLRSISRISAAFSTNFFPAGVREMGMTARSKSWVPRSSSSRFKYLVRAGWVIHSSLAALEIL